jgi:hypothetical protein
MIWAIALPTNSPAVDLREIYGKAYKNPLKIPETISRQEVHGVPKGSALFADP